MFADSCKRPQYGSILVSDLVSNIAHIGMTALGAGAGYAIGKSMGDTSDGVTGAFIGGGVGLVGGFYPTLLVQRRMLRSPGCTDPSLGRIFGYRLATMAALTPIAFGLRQIMPDECVAALDPIPKPEEGTMAGVMCTPNRGRMVVTSAIGTFGAPLLGLAILKEN